ncbi:ISL3 family transposase [Faecalicoccus pleomorphus]|uniref:ISL3 family transposase n=1 Tax=Faecalicoccus pleomorphus TaxID=1323 RepID=UPI00143184A1|nr:ISL3 family transposase [Faecalicoccus pleomorphus]NJE41579.1 ISL3 family transposase [Faecalicoccus pleomorphus]
MEKYILRILNLTPEDVKSIDPVPSKNGHSDYLITLKVKDHFCPKCGCLTNRVKDYRIQKVKAKIFNDGSTTVFYKSRRYLCKECGKAFKERTTLIGDKKTISQNTAASILEDLKPYNSTFSSVARKYNVSVTSVMNLFDRHVQIPSGTVSEIMCWDEFYFSRHCKNKYAFITLNFRNKAIIDILESRKTQFLSDYFFQIPTHLRNRVKIIIIDMNSTYRDIAHAFFKRATVCVDSFHVSQYFNDALNRIRKKVMNRYTKDKRSIEYRLLKQRRKLLFKRYSQLEYVEPRYDHVMKYHITEREIVRIILDIDPELKKAYELKEQYFDFNQITEETYTGRLEKEKELDRLILNCIESEIIQMAKCGKTLKEWKTEILNSFIWIDGKRVSNGPVEGKNSYIKKILFNANGFVNFERARNKIMYSQNHSQRYSVNEKQRSIKRKGKPRGKYKKSN